MSEHTQRGIVWEYASRAAGQIRVLCRKSVILHGLCTAAPRIERAARNGVCGRLLRQRSALRDEAHLRFFVSEWLFCAFLRYLPFLNLLPHPTYALIAFVLLIHLSFVLRLLRTHRLPAFSLLDLGVLLFALQYLLAAFVGAGGSGGMLSGVTTALMISLWFPAVQLLSDPAWLRRALYALAFSAGVCALWGIGQYFFGERELLWVDMTLFSDLGTRVCAVFSNPNILAAFLLLALPSVTSLLWENTRLWMRVLVAAAVASMLLCLIFTWTRGAWLGILAAALLFFMLYGKTTLTLLLFLAVPLPFAVPLLPHSVQSRFASIASFADSSARYRLYTWQGVGRMLQAYPFGIGAGREAFGAVFPQFAVSGTETVAHAHHLLLRVLCEVGIGGGIVFVGVLLFLLLRVCGGLYGLGEPYLRARLLGLFAALGAVLIMGGFDDVWYHYGVCALFWSICAMTEASVRQACERKENGYERA